MRIPLAAPRPVPTMMAVGVARPSAQGQLMTRIEMAWLSAVAKSPDKAIHTTKVTAAMPMTTGTKTPAILSAMRSMGALELVAASTSRMIPAKVVSSPTAHASITNQPRVAAVAPVTESPGFFSTGTGSPVRADSSRRPAPSTTTPSTGTDSPARTTRRSPTATSSVAISVSWPSRSTRARLGARLTRAATASVVLPLARASKYLPRSIRAKMMPAESKYIPFMAACAASMSMAPKAQAMR